MVRIIYLCGSRGEGDMRRVEAAAETSLGASQHRYVSQRPTPGSEHFAHYHFFLLLHRLSSGYSSLARVRRRSR